MILRSVCNGIVLPKEWKGTLKDCPNVRENPRNKNPRNKNPRNEYPDNHVIM